MLLFTGLTRRGSRQMKVTPVSSSIYYDLKDKYDDMLSCPCSNVTIPYEDFVSNPITSHPVCSSVFISNQWFEALYSTDASKHGVADFRTTASHQFQLLADLCAMSKETINQYVNDLKKEEILSFSILSNETLQKEVNSSLEKLKTRETGRMNTFLNYSRINMRSNYLISALNTNLIIGTVKNGTKYKIHATSVHYTKSDKNLFYHRILCGDENPHDKSYFLTMINATRDRDYILWFPFYDSHVPKEDGFYSSGFYAACTPLEAILLSTLDCLYQMKCLQVLNKYFPNITKSNIDLNASRLLSKPLNLSVEKLLVNLFIDQELPPQVDYPKYFDRCSPSYCIYTTTDEINISYALTLFISLYGSLIVVLRFIAPLLIQFYFKLRKMVTNRDIRQNLLMHMKETWMKFIRKMKRLNLFKDINERTEEATQQQRINTRVYLVLLLEGCFVFDSLLSSTLECFYSDSFCYRLLMSKVIYAVLGQGDYYPWYAIRPLVYDPTSRYLPNTSIKTILQNLMIEQWNPHNSYEYYYGSCLPTYCIYSQVTNQKTLVRIVLSLISLIGGLTLALRIIVPHLVKFIRRCFRSKRQQQQVEEDEQQQVHVSICNRLRTFLQNTASLVYAKVVELNLFRQRDFGSSFNPEIYQQLGRWATRLYIVCLICSFLLLLVYRIIEPATLTKTFSEPNFERYQSLKEKYKDQLICICKSFATPYDRFLQIQYDFHQICESEFATNEWRTEITSSIVANLSKYNQRDYRRHWTSHLQYLHGLCQLSIKTVVDDKEQLLSRSLITNELLSKNEFTNHFNTFEKQHRLNLPKLFNRLLILILNMSHGNAFMSTLGTNYRYLTPWDYHIKRHYYYAFTEALLYDHQCSCALSRYCISDAYLFENDSSKTIYIEGMKIGCTPSESFHQSTLQCFYNSSCLHLLVGNSIVPLVPRESRYLINTTIDELRKNLFLENWNTTSNYSAYFHECLPSICSYSLSIIFKWICPKLVLVTFHIYLYLKKKRNNSTYPIPSEITAENEDVCESIPSVTTHHDFNNDNYIDLSYMDSQKGDLVIRMGNGAASFGDPVSYSIGNLTCPTAFAIGHLNNDNYTDIAVINYHAELLSIFFGLGNGKFGPEKHLETKRLTFSRSIVLADINNDSIDDIVVSNSDNNTISVFINRGDGKFHNEKVSYLLTEYSAEHIALGDLNGDNEVDIVIS
ncbi:unnamed protein product, partial [Adineta steineri]